MTRTVVGVMGSGDSIGNKDREIAIDLGKAIAKEGWVLLSGGRDSGVMDAVNEGARGGEGLTIGILPDKNKKGLSKHVDVGIVTGMGNARNNINVLSSDVVIACGEGGAGTASEIALALKSKKPVILLNTSQESVIFFSKIGNKTGKKLVYETKNVDETITRVKLLLDELKREAEKS